MNDNDKVFSNVPYKASGNLNTVIGNPDVNINSAVTSNIMETDASGVVNNVGNNKNINFSTSLPVDNMFNSNISDSVLDGVKEDVQIVNNPVDEFIRKSNAVSNINENSLNSTSYTDNYSTNLDFIDNSVVFKNSDDSNVNVAINGSSQVKYENVYNVDNTKKVKKSFKIPSEFKTAIFILLILLLFVCCMETIYDFLRNLNIFG